MKLSTWRLLFDFGMLVLIWMVQLIIYPSFKFYQPDDLLNWYEDYMTAISIIVIPLMLGKLITTGIQFFKKRNVYTIISMVLIALVWASTFLQFVPMHNAIAAGDTSQELLQNLVSTNWIRTILWTLIFVWGLAYFLKRTVNPEIY
jgi:hypothetical protein